VRYGFWYVCDVVGALSRVLIMAILIGACLHAVGCLPGGK
jgi:hypothetical protein